MQLAIGVGGTGQGRVVAMAATSGTKSVKMILAASTFYNGSPLYGQGDQIDQGFIVYSGPDRTVTITGLQPGTAYYFYNAEYNTENGAIAYNTTGNSLIMKTHAAEPSPLPVVLAAFAGAVDAQALATLRWTTASEYNTDYFALERSTNGQDFGEIGRTPAAGSSSQSVAYRFLDSRPLAAATYYRLRQADLGGIIQYSSTITLSPPLKAVAREVEIYPNPGTSQSMQLAVQGYAGETISLRVMDALGRSVLSQTLAPTDVHYTASLALPTALTSGAYTLTLTSSAGQLRKHLLITN
ncbi:MAG: T9SS type A sorting domain-containing protein [Janthinobacterium lividum]